VRTFPPVFPLYLGIVPMFPPIRAGMPTPSLFESTPHIRRLVFCRGSVLLRVSKLPFPPGFSSRRHNSDSLLRTGLPPKFGCFEQPVTMSFLARKDAARHCRPLTCHPPPVGACTPKRPEQLSHLIFAHYRRRMEEIPGVIVPF